MLEPRGASTLLLIEYSEPLHENIACKKSIVDVALTPPFNAAPNANALVPTYSSHEEKTLTSR
jgi:hypothetical protein